MTFRKTLTLALALGSLMPLSAPAFAHSPGPGHCPPGLSWKHDSCQRPKAKPQKKDWHRAERRDHEGHHWRKGDHIRHDYRPVRHPGRYGLNPHATYWQTDGQVYRVDRRTGEILDLIGAAARVLNDR